jgi:hypothetical protein
VVSFLASLLRLMFLEIIKDGLFLVYCSFLCFSSILLFFRLLPLSSNGSLWILDFGPCDSWALDEWGMGEREGRKGCGVAGGGGLGSGGFVCGESEKGFRYGNT